MRAPVRIAVRALASAAVALQTRPMRGADALEDSYGGAVDGPRLRALMARSDARGGARLAAHGALLLATGTLVSGLLGSWWLLPALAVHGGALALLFCGLHETVHRTAFRSRRINDAVAAVLGFLVLVPANHFRAFHMDHHRFTQIPGKDPELAIAKPTTIGAYVLLLLGIPFLRDQVSGMAARAAGRVTDSFVAPHARPAIVREARLHAALYAAVAAAIAAGWTAPLLYWVAPLLLGQPVLRLVLLAEHAGCPLRADMHVNTRTTFTNPFVRFVTWNMPYHIEHHLYPGVPFFALPRLRRATSEARGTTSRGYARFHLGYVRALAAGRGAAFVRGGESGSA